MRIVYNESFARVWSEPKSPIVFSVVSKIPESSEGYAELCQRQIELIRKARQEFQMVFSITDFSACNPLSLRRAIDYVEYHVVRQFEAGLTYKAFVKPRNLVNQSILHTAMKLTDLPAIGFYDSFDAALESITSKINSITGPFNLGFFE